MAALSNGNLPSGRPGCPHRAACYFCPYVLFPLFLPLYITDVIFAALSNGNLPSGRPGRPHGAACYSFPYALFPLFLPRNVTDVISAALDNGKSPVFSLLDDVNCYIRHCVMINQRLPPTQAEALLLSNIRQESGNCQATPCLAAFAALFSSFLCVFSARFSSLRSRLFSRYCLNC